MKATRFSTARACSRHESGSAASAAAGARGFARNDRTGACNASGSGGRHG